jgi:Zn-finger nucleic acid-binding protein
MLCPYDKSTLNRVEINSQYGQPLFLDQCPECGGIWFDESELFRARQGEAYKVDKVDIESLAKPITSLKIASTCPKDGASLFQFSDKYFPQEIILERCPTCHGLWLNRGYFVKYQQYREKKLTSNIESGSDQKFREELNNLAADYRDRHSSETLRKLGEFLSTPMEPGAIQDSRAEQTVTTFINILMALFRAFILRF